MNRTQIRSKLTSCYLAVSTRMKQHRLIVGCLILLILVAIFVPYFIGGNKKTEALIGIAGVDNAERVGDIVFVHGLGATAESNWGTRNADYYWPRSVGEEFPDAGVWLLDFDAYPSDWQGGAMPTSDRAENLLAQMRHSGIGDRPIVFVCHSLGGIIAIQMIEKGVTLSNPDFKNISTRTKGIAFLSTPMAGADQASLLNKFRKVAKSSVLVSELERDAPGLRRLITWYRDNTQQIEIQNLVFYETRDTSVFGRIVTESSANPGITGVFPIPVDEDHLTICRPSSANELVPKAVARFITENLEPDAIPSDIPINEFLEEFKLHREPANKLRVLKEKFHAKQFSWEAYILRVIPATPSKTSLDPRPAYVISNAEGANGANRITARFRQFKSNWKEDVEIGSKIRITGIFDSEKSNAVGAVLKECVLDEILAPS